MEETAKKQEQEPETVSEPVIEKVTNFPPVRKRSEKQDAWSKQLGKQSKIFKQQKKERLIQQTLNDQQVLPDQQSKDDVATIKELIKDEEPVKQDRTAIYIGLGIVAIIGCGAYCWYSRKDQSLTATAATSKAPDVQPIKVGKSGITDME